MQRSREAAARLLIERGAQTAVVTDGEAGSIAITAAGEHASAPPVGRPGLFPVGSGDCFLAGLVGALDLGGDLTTALGIAADTGTANAQVPGAATFDTLPLRQLVADAARADARPAGLRPTGRASRRTG